MSGLVGSKLESDFFGATKLPCYTARPGSGSTGPVRLAALPNDSRGASPPPQRTDNEIFDDELLSLSLSARRKKKSQHVAPLLVVLPSHVLLFHSSLHFSRFGDWQIHFEANCRLQ